MQFNTLGRIVIILICCLMLFGCASDGSLKRWGEYSLAGAGIGGAVGGVAGAAKGTAAGPVGAVAGALAGGIFGAFSSSHKQEDVTKAQPPASEEDIVVIVEEPVESVPTSEALGSIYFTSSSAELSSQAQSVLKDIAIKAKRYPELSLTLHGYTDSTGQPYYNKSLAERRAESVKTYLESLGAKPDQITIGTGGIIEENNQTTTGWTENRKVDVIGSIN